ncbi:hypothetical protein DPMN_050028 [Dreissena polymorpha]|uniref:Uncharacterized protein n=1 Tax=Dreissena polymorpha TaxID=45954 RepID=A0A9D4CGD6_DREPO|nr:hypothetical protein DPMN_050028 [Dreissena polymorpha]
MKHLTIVDIQHIQKVGVMVCAFHSYMVLYVVFPSDNKRPLKTSFNFNLMVKDEIGAAC